MFIAKPRLLVLDEPTIGIDPWVKSRFTDIILEMTKTSDIVVATHDLDLLGVADQIHLLSDGKIVGVFNTFDEFYENMNLAQVKE